MAVVWQCEKDLEVRGLPAEAEQPPQTQAKGNPPQPKGESKEEATPPPPQDRSPVPLETLTVGRPYLLRCQGEPAFFERGKLKLLPPVVKSEGGTSTAGPVSPSKPPQLFNFALLEVERIDEKSADLLVTSYIAKKNELKGWRLTDGKETVELDGVTAMVHTVLPPQGSQPPKPFGPFGPIELAWPWYFWAILIAILLFLVGGILGKAWRIWQRKKLMDKLAEYDTPLAPLSQLSKDLRKIHRRLDFIEKDQSADDVAVEESAKIDEAFRLYLIRELRIPALDWSESALVKEASRRHKNLQKMNLADIRLTLKELPRLKRTSEKISLGDCYQLSKLCQKTADRLSRDLHRRERHSRSLR